MTSLISDEVLETFSIVAPVDEVATMVHRRVGDVIDRFDIYAPYPLEREHRTQILGDFVKTGGTAP